MQAIRIDSFLLSPSFSSLSPTTLPTPKPTGGEFLVRITHVALQHVDLLYAQGKHQNNNARRGHVHPPFILGIDFAGIVLSVPGKERTSCKDIKVGDRVMGSKLGAFAEHICAKKDQIWRVPDNIGNEAAAALAGAAVSYGAVIQMAEVKKGETVLVTGASGGLGIVACQVARALGASVVGLVTSKEKADQLRMQLGVGAVVNRKGWETEVKELAGDGVHAVIDNVGVVESSLRCLRFGGRIVLVGFAGRNGVMEEIAMNKVLLKGARIIGYRFGEQSRRDPQKSQAIWTGYLEMLGSGSVQPAIDPKRYIGIAEIPKALHDLQDKKVNGKAVVRVRDEANAKL